MRKWRVGTFSMGILLIFIGVLLLAGQVSGTSTAEMIFKWWPLVLVVLGCEVLAHVYFSKEEHPKVKYDGFSIFMIIFIVVISTGVYAAGYVIENVPGIKDLSVFGVYRNESKFTKTITIKPEDQKKLTIKNYYGNVVVKQAEGADIEVEAEINIRNNDEAVAQSVADSIVEVSKNVGINVSTKTTSYNGKKDKVENPRVNYVIKVPKGISVNVDNHYGNVSVANISETLKIDNNNGDVTVENIAKSVVINNSYGRVEAVEVKGDLEVKNNNGHIEGRTIEGNVKIFNKYGDIELSGANKAIDLSTNNGEITFESNKILEKSLNIENKYGRINISIPKAQKAHFVASTAYGRIETNMTSSTIKELNNKQSIDETVGNGDVSINLKTNNADISIEGN